MTCGYFDTAAELLAEHASVCEHAEPHDLTTETGMNEVTENAA